MMITFSYPFYSERSCTHRYKCKKLGLPLKFFLTNSKLNVYDMSKLLLINHNRRNIMFLTKWCQLKWLLVLVVLLTACTGSSVRDESQTSTPIPSESYHEAADNQPVADLPTSAGNEQRLALVIGNSQYPGDLLPNPVHDAQDLAKVLRGYGFTVIHKQNLNREEMDLAIIDFAQRLTQNGIGLFFFAGHGIQIDQHNYLIPIGPKIQKASLVKYRAVEAQMVVDMMNEAGSRVNLVILDACRDNPYRSYFRSQDGLATMDAPHGTLISYSTAPGKKSADGDGRNGLFTKHLLKMIQQIPGSSIEEVLKQTAGAVAQESEGKQVPWRLSSFTGNFCFADCATAETVQQAAELEQQRLNEIRRRRQQEEQRLAQLRQQRLNAELQQLAEPEQKPQSGNVFQDRLKKGGFGPKMVWISAGRFRMGDIQGGGLKYEQPVHDVFVNQFAMGVYEVTFAEYDKFADATGRRKPDDGGWGRGNRPVIDVSWHDADCVSAMVERTNRPSLIGYRLRLSGNMPLVLVLRPTIGGAMRLVLIDANCW
jgi:hypothetical protein